MESTSFGAQTHKSHEMSSRPEANTVVEARNLTKAFGATKAVRGVSFTIPSQKVLGVIGGNGAGKSTLMNLLSGVLSADSGELSIMGTPITLNDYNPNIAARLGVRFVHQELSLCTNLTVYENFFIERSAEFKGVRWRAYLKGLVKKSLNDVFPGCRIDAMSIVGELSIAERQMVEIVRAITDPNLKLLILDEPTSSLNTEQVAHLASYIQKIMSGGKSFVFISHRLREILKFCDEVLVMRDGQLIWRGVSQSTSEQELIHVMGGVEKKVEEQRKEQVDRSDRRELVRFRSYRADRLAIDELSLHSGEIVGVAGLEGSGQEDLLHAVFSASKRNASLQRHGKTAFVSGDRAREGVFRYWSIANNISITKLASAAIYRVVDRSTENALTGKWFERLGIVAPDQHVRLTQLSGGNQQKALIARALASDADIILLDDPTRGVDIETKTALYRLFRDSAAEGKLLIWYSSEDDEFLEVDRTVILSNGRLVGDLERTEFSQNKILELSFSNIGKDDQNQGPSASQRWRERRGLWKRLGFAQRTMMALLALIITIAALGIANTNTVSEAGLSLLLGSAIPLVFAGIAQMFVIAGSDIDLGLGTFVALTNVVTGFILSRSPVLGLAIFAVGLLAYGSMGFLIHSRRIPAIVVTLGASFVWYGLALTISKIPGGSSPDWLTSAFDVTPPGIPEPIFMSLLAGLVAYLILQKWRYGIILRAFGNNPQSIRNAGWSTAKARVALYVLSGVFGICAGLAFTAVTTAADPNATGNTYTLLSVAAVVIGGGSLLGGIVGPFGAVFGALTLALIGSLLGLLGIGSDYQSGVQGILLVLILAMRLLRRRQLTW